MGSGEINCFISNVCSGKSNSECVEFKNGSNMCVCRQGFSESDGICKDVNECLFEPCDSKYSYCKNKNGSYDCICNENYHKAADDLCEIEDAFTEKKSDFMAFLPNSFLIFIAILSALGLMAVIFKVSRISGKPRDQTSIQSVAASTPST